MPPLALALPLLAVALLAAAGRRQARALERAVGTRLRPGAGGIVAGAEPIEREGEGRDAVLLLHGFGDTPQALRYLADALHRRGWTVHAPLLPGHGRSLREFAASRADDWERAAYAAYDALRARHERVAVAGLSMGGALAALCARRDPSMPALVLLAPYLSMPTAIRRCARLHPVWGAFAPFVPAGGERSIVDERERPLSLAYGAVAGTTLRELLRIVERASAALPEIRVPTLVVHSRDDHRVPPDAAERAFARLGAPVRDLMWVEGSGHLVTVDLHREPIFERAAEWLERHGPRTSAD